MTEQAMVAITNSAICLCIAACTFTIAYWLHSSDGLWSLLLMLGAQKTDTGTKFQFEYSAPAPDRGDN